jgi:hypothetical protein
MNEPENLSEPLKDLIDDYLSGLLDETRIRELEERLRADADARRYFVRYARLHTDIHLEVRARKAGERALDRIEQLIQDGFLSRRSLLRKAVARLTIAAGLLFAVVAGWLLVKGRTVPNDGQGHEPAVAWLVNAQNCLWSDDVGPAGDMHQGKVLTLARGLAEIRFQCGARVVLNGPASLQILSGKGARLMQGKLTARVPEAAKGFEVLSPQGKVIDLGTEFGLSVSENGSTNVYVFEGKVEAHPADAGQAQDAGVSLTRNQAARIAAGKVTVEPAAPGAAAEQFVRAIVPSPVIVPRTLRLTFDRPIQGSIGDANGLGTGLTHRLPGTGGSLPEQDLHLRLNTAAAQLALITTRSDIRNQVRLGQGEYLGVRLSDLGFTGKEDFAVTAVIPNTPALEDYGQFGLYAGTRSDRNIRGGLIKWGRKDPGQNTQFLVNNNGGDDTDLYKVGLLSPGTTLRLTLSRTGGKYSLTVENLTDQADRGASTLVIRHPEFLDGEPDLFVGLFGANPYSDVQKTVVVKEFSVTVWTLTKEQRGRE